ncbi:hypothetical protein SAMN04488109_2222 [Chryseolinea serpens]|uniref:Chaperone of endosialidase n=1 Tax=Chryseolinea serpens TaxID=947013 RepID=A0A1M5NBK1_9BACT|nr:hypothetical protein [Chryseolinea serpens]SHG86855.1 hypothetical protein SAMN04488109_2222 [Chryseolinea serpens]
MKINFSIVKLTFLCSFLWASNLQAQPYRSALPSPGGSGDSGNGDYGILHYPATGQATIGAEAQSDNYANLNLASFYGGIRRIWQWSKRPSSDNHFLRLYYYGGTGWTGPFISVNPTTSSTEFRGQTSSIGDGIVKIASTNSNTYLQIGLNTEYAFLQSHVGRPLRINELGNNVVLNLTGGSVGIGTETLDAKLTVNGDVHAKEVRVNLNSPGPDYVFEENYALPSLGEVEAYITANKHLAEVPSAEQMKQNGLNVGDMNLLLLKKMEEMTLYMIEMKKEIKALQEENEKLKEAPVEKVNSAHH